MSVEHTSTDMIKSTAWLVSHPISTPYCEFGRITHFLSSSSAKWG